MKKSHHPIVSLVAGIVLLDLLINLPAFSVSSPLGSLLVPSLDLLVVLALLMGVSQASSGLKTGFSIAVSVLLTLMLGWETVERVGPREALGLLQAGPALRSALLVVACIAALAACGTAAFFASRLALRGLADPFLRNVFLVVAAVCAVLQAATGLRVFAPSMVPRIARQIGAALR